MTDAVNHPGSSEQMASRIGPYEIIREIGRGGMGVVYLARDTKLDRDVAIKCLPNEFLDDADRLARFEREAKLLASLNHPNIATIHGLEEVEGKRYLILEYIEGKTLEERLRGGAIPLDEALPVAIQIAEAIEAAHEKGIIHRDLKPANIKFTSDDQVKVLDFGLAKAIDDRPSSIINIADSPTVLQEASPTLPGIILGTAGYLSPEQARGRPVDKRTDIFAFGCVMYEMLTGQRAFPGENATDAIGATLHTDVDFSALPPGTPPMVRHVLRWCLQRDRKQRLHDIADARIELTQMEPTPQVSPAPVRGYRIALGVLGIITLLAILMPRLLPEISESGESPSVGSLNPLANARFSRITDFPGSEFHAAISPDGQFVVFISDRDGPFEVFLSQVDTGGIRDISSGTEEFQLVDDTRSPIRTVGFSGDGTEIWFRSMPDRRLRAMPLLGGTVRKLLGTDAVTLSWSPDGQRIVYHERRPGDPINVADPDGANSRMILEASKGMHQHFPTWSVDGQWIYLVRGRPSLDMSLWRVRPDGGEAQRLTWEQLDVRYPAPIDEQTVVYCALDADGAGPWLWAVDVETKISVRASIGLEQYSSVAASADRRRLVATMQTPRAVLWSVPILDRVATESDAKTLPDVATNRAFAPRLHGSWLFYLASRGSGDGLWRHRDGKSEEIWRGSTTPLLEPVAVSPDGEFVALVLRRDNQRRVHILSSDGATRKALTADVDVRGAPEWSPDGQWIVVGGIKDGVSGLYKMPVIGGAAQLIAEGEALNPVWSPAGDLIVYAGAEVGPTATLLAVRPDGDPVDFPEILVLNSGERMRFLPDGSGLVYMKGLRSVQDFWLLDIETMKDRQLTQLGAGATMRTFDITPDGSAIVFDRLTEDSDIVLIEREISD